MQTLIKKNQRNLTSKLKTQTSIQTNQPNNLPTNEPTTITNQPIIQFKRKYK